MKKIILILLCIVPLLSKATDTLTLHLKSHKADHYLAEFDENILVTIDTTGNQDHFEIQFLNKIKNTIILKVYINNKLRYKVNTVVKKHSTYAFYYHGKIQNARIEYSNVIYNIKL